MLFRLDMNKNMIELYGQALKKVLEEYGITEVEMFNSNNDECVEARSALIVALSDMGMSDKDIFKARESQIRQLFGIVAQSGVKGLLSMQGASLLAQLMK